jgi:hypothetical protein
LHRQIASLYPINDTKATDFNPNDYGHVGDGGFDVGDGDMEPGLDGADFYAEFDDRGVKPDLKTPTLDLDSMVLMSIQVSTALDLEEIRLLLASGQILQVLTWYLIWEEALTRTL